MDFALGLRGTRARIFVPRFTFDSIESCPSTSFNRSLMLVRPSPCPSIALSKSKPMPQCSIWSSAPRSGLGTFASGCALLHSGLLLEARGTDKVRFLLAGPSKCSQTSNQFPPLADPKFVCKNSRKPTRAPSTPASTNANGATKPECPSQVPKRLPYYGFF